MMGFLPPDSDNPLSSNFNQLGFTSMYFLSNIGSMILSIVIIPFILAIQLICYVLRKIHWKFTIVARILQN